MSDIPTGRPEESGRPGTVAHPVARAIGSGLAAAGWQVRDEPWPDRIVTYARTSQVMWQTFFSKIHTTVAVVPLQGGEDRAWLDGLQRHVVHSCVSSAGGLPHGLQSGSAVITVVVGQHLGEDVLGWARRTHGREFAVMTHPVAVDSARGTVTRPGRALIGAALNGHFKRVVQRHVVPIVTPHS